MHDIKAIRDNPEAFERAWASRGLGAQTPELLRFDERLRAAQTLLQAAQNRRNEVSKLVGQAKAKRDDAAANALIEEAEQLRYRISVLDQEVGVAKAELELRLVALPNLPADDVPTGADEHGNVEVRRWGEPFAIENPKDHVDLGAGLGMMDFEAAARLEMWLS